MWFHSFNVVGKTKWNKYIALIEFITLSCNCQKHTELPPSDWDNFKITNMCFIHFCVSRIKGRAWIIKFNKLPLPPHSLPCFLSPLVIESTGAITHRVITKAFLGKEKRSRPRHTPQPSLFQPSGNPHCCSASCRSGFAKYFVQFPGKLGWVLSLEHNSK